VARWRELDPLLRARAALTAAGTAAEKLDEIDSRTGSDVAELARQVLERPAPEPSGAWTTCGATGAGNGGTDLPAGHRRRAGPGDGPRRPGGAARRGRGLGGVFKTTAGLRERFGPDRVWNTPISEQAIAGAAMGAAMGGLRPVAEIMFADFYATCWDQVANEIAKVRYMTGGQVSMPLVLRGANGSGGLGFGSQHGQSLENWAMCVPGLKIVSPAGPAEAFGLLGRGDPGRGPGARLRAQGAVRAQGGGR
jgi:hypothetical protein